MRALALAIAIALAAPAAGQAPLPGATPVAREALADFARCVVRRSPAKAHSALTMDFRTRQYRSALLALGDANRDCFRNRSTMRAGGLPFESPVLPSLRPVFTGGRACLVAVRTPSPGQFSYRRSICEQDRRHVLVLVDTC